MFQSIFQEDEFGTLKKIGEDIYHVLLYVQAYIGLAGAKKVHSTNERALNYRNLVTRHMADAAKDVMELIDRYGMNVPIPEKWVAKGASFLLPEKPDCDLEDSDVEEELSDFEEYEEDDPKEDDAEPETKDEEEQWTVNHNCIWTSDRPLHEEFRTNLPGLVKMVLYWASVSDLLKVDVSITREKIKLLDRSGNLIDKTADKKMKRGFPLFAPRQWQLTLIHEEDDIRYTLPDAIERLLTVVDPNEKGITLKNMLKETGGFKKIAKGVDFMNDPQKWCSNSFGPKAQRKSDGEGNASAPAPSPPAETTFDQYTTTGKFALSKTDFNSIEAGNWKDGKDGMKFLDKKISSQMEKVTRLILGRETGMRIKNGKAGDFGKGFFQYEASDKTLIAQNLSLMMIRTMTACCNYALDLSIKMRELPGPKLTAREALECQGSIEANEVDLQQLRENLAVMCGGLCKDIGSAKRIPPRFPENAAATPEDDSVRKFKKSRINRHVSVMNAVIQRPFQRTIYWEEIEENLKFKAPQVQGDGRPPQRTPRTSATSPDTKAQAKRKGNAVSLPAGDKSPQVEGASPPPKRTPRTPATPPDTKAQAKRKGPPVSSPAGDESSPEKDDKKKKKSDGSVSSNSVIDPVLRSDQSEGSESSESSSSSDDSSTSEDSKSSGDSSKKTSEAAGDETKEQKTKESEAEQEKTKESEAIAAEKEVEPEAEKAPEAAEEKTKELEPKADQEKTKESEAIAAEKGVEPAAEEAPEAAEEKTKESEAFTAAARDDLQADVIAENLETSEANDKDNSEDDKLSFQSEEPASLSQLDNALLLSDLAAKKPTDDGEPPPKKARLNEDLPWSPTTSPTGTPPKSPPEFPSADDDDMEIDKELDPNATEPKVATATVPSPGAKTRGRSKQLKEADASTSTPSPPREEAIGGSPKESCGECQKSCKGKSEGSHP